MKKTTTILVLILLFWNIDTFSQISSFQFEGTKTYETGNKIAYFYVNGITDNHQAHFVQNELRNKSSINRFFIYPYKNGTNRCMIDCSENINESTIKAYINESINHYNLSYSQATNLREFYLNLYAIKDMPKYNDTGNRKSDVLSFKEKFTVWKEQNPKKYLLIKTIPIDTFIQK